MNTVFILVNIALMCVLTNAYTINIHEDGDILSRTISHTPENRVVPLTSHAYTINEGVHHDKLAGDVSKIDTIHTTLNVEGQLKVPHFTEVVFHDGKKVEDKPTFRAYTIDLKDSDNVHAVPVELRTTESKFVPYSIIIKESNDVPVVKKLDRSEKKFGNIAYSIDIKEPLNKEDTFNTRSLSLDKAEVKPAPVSAAYSINIKE